VTFLELGRHKLINPRLPAKLDAILNSARAAFAGAGFDQFPLELRKAA
jgi:hypothetical protein